tara:strand:- start:36 stop:215 length:180 start_codon:yes stop_codon:yes gene_type:complete
MEMYGEASPRLYRIVVEDAKWPELDVSRVIIVVKGKVPVGGEPLVLEKMPILASHNLIH